VVASWCSACGSGGRGRQVGDCTRRRRRRPSRGPAGRQAVSVLQGPPRTAAIALYHRPAWPPASSSPAAPGRPTLPPRPPSAGTMSSARASRRGHPPRRTGSHTTVENLRGAAGAAGPANRRRHSPGQRPLSPGPGPLDRPRPRLYPYRPLPTPAHLGAPARRSLVRVSRGAGAHRLLVHRAVGRGVGWPRRAGGTRRAPSSPPPHPRRAPLPRARRGGHSWALRKEQRYLSVFQWTFVLAAWS